MKKSKDNFKNKYQAIEKLIKHGRRGSEWQEAGLLNVIEEIIDDKITDLSSQSLKALMEKAKNY